MLSSRTKQTMGFSAQMSILVVAAAQFLLLFCQADTFPEFSHRQHPVYTHLNEDAIEPVIMGKYFFRSNLAGRTSSESGLFAPQQASYKFQGTDDYFCQNADVLIAPHISKDNANNGDDFVNIQLTRNARVFVLLVLNKGWDYGSRTLDITSTAPGGVPSNWFGEVYPVEHDGPIHNLVDVGRWADVSGGQPKLKQFAAAVEVTLDADNRLVLPHHKTLKVNGRGVQRLHVILAPEGSTSFPLGPHSSPGVPANFDSFLEPGTTVLPSVEEPVPNESCPQWLHDTYVVEDTGIYNGTYWQTWHPSIDPVYWCYFDHEHGGYPGNYRPKFHYTAYHTPDSSTADGRQAESHEGFKVIPFVAEDGRAVVMVLHAHMSNARRFHARHHTFILTVHNVINENEWEMEMEIYRKADFGPLKAINTDDSLQLPDQLAIQAEIWDSIRQKAERDTYVLDVDKLPDNDGYWVSGGGTSLSSALKGRYEEWRCPLNCAYNPARDYNSGLKFEFHNQQTAMKDIHSTSPDNLQRLSGGGMHRSVVFVAGGPGDYTHQLIEVNAENCVFGGVSGAPSRGADGVFYTDPYFTETVDPLNNSLTLEALPQFIKPGFQTIVIGGQRAITNEDPNVGINSYDGNMIRRFYNTEMSIKLMQN